jgi:glycerate kinase
MRRTGETDYARLPGAGAAGGLGFGLLAFLGARFEPGFDLFANHANLLRRLDGVDLVITGEGAIDRSTLMGKGVGQVARLCRALTIPCLGLAGVASNDARRRRSFTLVHTLTDLTDARSAKKNAAAWLEKLAARAANEAGRIVA